MPESRDAVRLISNEPQTSQYMLALSAFSSARCAALEEMAEGLGSELVCYNKTRYALRWLEDHDPRVVVFDSQIEGARELCVQIRAKRYLRDVPVIALLDQYEDDLARDLYRLGADEVLPSCTRLRSIARLRSLAHARNLVERSSRLAVLADPPGGHCDVLGPVLHNAGFDVRYVSEPNSLSYYERYAPALIVMNSRVLNPRTAIAAAQRRGCESTWVVTTEPSRVVRLKDDLGNLESVLVVATDTSPTDILFKANQLANQLRTPRRRAERTLYSTQVRFRHAGTTTEDHGVTYNVSSSGMYVRTLAPPPCDHVWLQVRPPGQREWVCLEGEIVWRRPFDPACPAAVPPGFGVKLLGGLGDGLRRWKLACDDPSTPDRVKTEPPRRGHPETGEAPASTLRSATLSSREEAGAQQGQVSLPVALVNASSIGNDVDAAAEEDQEDDTFKGFAFTVVESSSVAASAALGSHGERAGEDAQSVHPRASREAHDDIDLEQPARASRRSGTAQLALNKVFGWGLVVGATASLISLLGVSALAPLATTSAAEAPADRPYSELPADGDLAPGEGAIVVDSKRPATVYVNGVASGATRERIRTHCGHRQVRVGVGEPVRWLEAGGRVLIPCGGTKTITRKLSD